jgi:VanZ family protein
VVAFCVGVGLWDEWRQLSLPGRSAGWDDLLFDGLGIALGVMLAGWLWRRVVSVAGVDQRH